ncbi:MAG: PKD domain-containing protein [Candidatus Bathyarchaeia archaeon]
MSKFDDLEEKLRRLKRLYDEGAMSLEAYEKLRKEYEEAIGVGFREHIEKDRGETRKYKRNYASPMIIVILVVIFGFIFISLMAVQMNLQRVTNTITVIHTLTETVTQKASAPIYTITQTETITNMVTTFLSTKITQSITRTILQKETVTSTITITMTSFIPAVNPPQLTIFTPEVNGLTVRINGVTLPGTPGTTITRIHWDWGDGYSEDHWFPASHTYSRGGTYTITITAYQSDGLSNMIAITLTVPEVFYNI